MRNLERYLFEYKRWVACSSNAYIDSHKLFLRACHCLALFCDTLFFAPLPPQPLFTTRGHTEFVLGLSGGIVSCQIDGQPPKCCRCRDRHGAAALLLACSKGHTNNLQCCEFLGRGSLPHCVTGSCRGFSRWICFFFHPCIALIVRRFNYVLT